MSWAKAIILVIQMVSRFVSYLHDRQTFKAGEAEAVSQALQEAQQRIEKARAARRAADAGGVPDQDPYRRD